MFIAQNPIERSVFVVVTFWYTTLFALSGFHGVPVWHVVYLFPVSLLITAAGGGVSIIWMIMTYRKSRGITGQDLKRGSRIRQASFSLGSLPHVPVPEQTRWDDERLLTQLPWWQPIRQRAPVYADAIRAVLRIMNTHPRFPASPIPGGHGGRSLIEHSVAVAGQMLREANGWTYSGQRDKQGNLRVPLQSGRPHRFQPSDGPLLVLTGLAHDIGKMACWDVEGAPPGRQKGAIRRALDGVRRWWGDTEPGAAGRGPLLQVKEVGRMHDTEGARLLRRVPEVMALPLADRTAMLTAIAYYHHPKALPMAPWVTDKVRSLTELLIKADIETGRQEGHVLTEHDPDREYGHEDTLPPASDAPESTTGDGALDVDVATLDLAARLDAGRKQQHADMQQGNYELRLLETALGKPGALNGSHKERLNRMAWKRGQWIYVMEPLARKIIANSPDIKDPMWRAVAFDDTNGNAAPFTKAVLQQLDARGALLTEFDGKRYPATRAVFWMQLKKDGNRVPVFVVNASAFPDLYVPDPPKDHIFKLTGPLWGTHTARQGAENASRGEAASAETRVKAEPLPAAAFVPRSPPRPDETGLDDADLPFGMDTLPAMPEMEPAVGTQAPSNTDANAEAPAGADVNEVVVDLAEVLLDTVLESGWPLHRLERNGTTWVLVDVNSEGGRKIEKEAKKIRAMQSGLTFSGIKRVELEHPPMTAYAFEVPGLRQEI